nr:50S ribosomal protein L10 [Mycoplasmopsis bovis]
MKQLKKLVKKFLQLKDSVVAEYRGLTVADLKNLRVSAKKLGIEVKVYKNRLFKLAD